DERAFERATLAIPKLEPVIEESVGVQNEESPTELPDLQTTQSKSYELHVRGERWRITLDLTDDPLQQVWLDFAQSEAGPPGAFEGGGKKGPRARRLRLRIYTGHPFMQTWARDAGALEALLRMAIGVGLAVTTAKISGVKGAETVLSDLNRFLGDALARSDELSSIDEEPE